MTFKYKVVTEKWGICHQHCFPIPITASQKQFNSMVHKIHNAFHEYVYQTLTFINLPFHKFKATITDPQEFNAASETASITARRLITETVIMPFNLTRQPPTIYCFSVSIMKIAHYTKSLHKECVSNLYLSFVPQLELITLGKGSTLDDFKKSRKNSCYNIKYIPNKNDTSFI